MLSAAACSTRAGAVDAGASSGCDTLFGRPTSNTGLGAAECAPRCACAGQSFVPPEYDAAFVRSLVDDFRLAAPFAPLTSDPYAGAAPGDPSDVGVCAVVWIADGGARPHDYRVETFASEDAARAAGARVTHFGRCGLCSTLADLAVYMRENDLSAPVRDCGLRAAPDGGTAFDADVDCLRGLGFTLPCAQIWAYNTQHTRAKCLSICIEHLFDKYNLPDGGALNACLRCDEEQSGPVFKAVAGRTRRNTGLPNAICRPCSEVRPLVHAY
jgi:hypothetical protein